MRSVSGNRRCQWCVCCNARLFGRQTRRTTLYIIRHKLSVTLRFIRPLRNTCMYTQPCHTHMYTFMHTSTLKPRLDGQIIDANQQIMVQQYPFQIWETCNSPQKRPIHYIMQETSHESVAVADRLIISFLAAANVRKWNHEKCPQNYREKGWGGCFDWHACVSGLLYT
jgi:hypothetical protein